MRIKVVALVHFHKKSNTKNDFIRNIYKTHQKWEQGLKRR